MSGKCLHIAITDSMSHIKAQTYGWKYIHYFVAVIVYIYRCMQVLQTTNKYTYFSWIHAGEEHVNGSFSLAAQAEIYRLASNNMST